MLENELKIKDVKGIIKLYKQFSRYDTNTPVEILNHILPSLGHKQYKIHKDDDKIFAFTNWAYLNRDAEKRFKKTGRLLPADWKSGNKLWHIDTVCQKDLKKVMAWTKKKFTEKFGVGHPIRWLRTTKDTIIRSNKKLTKESWLNGRI